MHYIALFLLEKGGEFMPNGRLIRDLTSSNNLLVTQVLKQYIFGDRDIREFSESNVYNQGDVVIFFNDDGSYILRQPKENDVTGKFEATKWSEIIVSELIQHWERNSGMVIVSDIQPTNPDNLIWYQSFANRYLSNDFDHLYTSTEKIRSKSGLIMVSDDKPLNIDNLIWFEPIDIQTSNDFDGF